MSLTKNDVTFIVDVTECKIPIRGNFMVTDNDEDDKRAENEVLERLRRGDVYAWCSITVRAWWNDLVGIDCLSACSLKDEEDLRKTIIDHEMYEGALRDLNERVYSRKSIEEFNKPSRKLTQEARADIYNNILNIESQSYPSEEVRARIIFNYVASLIESANLYPSWFEEK